MVVIEDLQVRNLRKSAAGTKENPGRKVKPKSGLNRSILDQAWARWRRLLEYKQEWRGERTRFGRTGPARNVPAVAVSASNRKSQAGNRSPDRL